MPAYRNHAVRPLGPADGNLPRSFAMIWMESEPQIGKAAIPVLVAGRGHSIEDALRVVIHLEVEITIAAKHHQIDPLLLELRTLIKIDQGLLIALGGECGERAVGQYRNLQLGGALMAERRLGR